MRVLVGLQNSGGLVGQASLENESKLLRGVDVKGRGSKAENSKAEQRIAKHLRHLEPHQDLPSKK